MKPIVRTGAFTGGPISLLWFRSGCERPFFQPNKVKYSIMDVPRVLRVLRIGCPSDHAAISRIDSGGRPPHCFLAMCNRFRSIREWPHIPRDLYRGPRINFEFNPNVAPT